MEFIQCDRCGASINYGSAHVSITRSVEQAEYNIATDETTISVLDSVQVMSLCGDCGNKFNADNIAKIIKAIPSNSSGSNDN